MIDEVEEREGRGGGCRREGTTVDNGGGKRGNNEGIR